MTTNKHRKLGARNLEIGQYVRQNADFGTDQKVIELLADFERQVRLEEAKTVSDKWNELVGCANRDFKFVVWLNERITALSALLGDGPFVPESGNKSKKF